jgi:hypothetical protein
MALSGKGQHGTQRERSTWHSAGKVNMALSGKGQHIRTDQDINCTHVGRTLSLCDLVVACQRIPPCTGEIHLVKT